MLTTHTGLPKMEKFSKLDQNQKTKYVSMTNTQSQLKDVVMLLDIFLKEGAVLPKTVSNFLRASNGNCYRVELTGKRVNLGDAEGLQIPCILHFSGEAKFVSKLKDILPQSM